MLGVKLTGRCSFLSNDDNSTLDILHLTSNIQQLTFNIQIK